MNTNTVVSEDWHPARVKAELEMAGTNLAQLAKKHKYSHISEVLHRPWVGPEKIVAKALGLRPEDIWPSRYKRSRDRAIKLTRNPNSTVRRKAERAAEESPSV